MRNKEPKKNAEKYWHVNFDLRKPNLMTLRVILKIVFFSILSAFWWFVTVGTLYLIMSTTSPFGGGWQVTGSTIMVIILIMSLVIVPPTLYLSIKGKKW